MTDLFYIKPKALWTLKHDEVSCPGSSEEIEYVPEMTEEGYKLKETGKKINVQAKIQSYADECDLKTIVLGLLENGIDLTNGVKYKDDDIIDVVELQNASIHDMQKARADYEKNLAYYQAELEKARKALEESQKQTEENGGEK